MMIMMMFILALAHLISQQFYLFSHDFLVLTFQFLLHLQGIHVLLDQQILLTGDLVALQALELEEQTSLVPSELSVLFYQNKHI